MLIYNFKQIMESQRNLYSLSLFLDTSAELRYKSKQDIGLVNLVFCF